MSLIEALTGDRLVSVTFVMDYLQLTFNNWRLTCYTWPFIYHKDLTLYYDDRDYASVLLSLISANVIKAEEVEEEALIMRFAEAELRISLREDDYTCPEAAMLVSLTTPEWNVWQA